MESRGIARDLLGSIGVTLIVSFSLSRLSHKPFSWECFLCLAAPYVTSDVWKALRRRRQGKRVEQASA